jgi:hypothetical protein
LDSVQKVPFPVYGPEERSDGFDELLSRELQEKKGVEA